MEQQIVEPSQIQEVQHSKNEEQIQESDG